MRQCAIPYRLLSNRTELKSYKYSDWRVICKKIEKMVQNANGHPHPEGIDLDTSRTPSPISVNVKSDECQDMETWRAQVIPMTDQIRRLQTIIRDQESSRSDFVFSADRLIRLVVEEGLNQLPYKVRFSCVADHLLAVVSCKLDCNVFQVPQ